MALVQGIRGWVSIQRGAAVALFWSTIWVLYLAVPAVAVWTAPATLDTRLLMTLLLTGFVVCYVTYWWLCITGRLASGRQAGAAGFLLLVAIVAAVVGTRFSLGYTLVYAASAIAFAAAPRFRLAVAAVFAVALLSAGIGVLTRSDPWSIAVQAMVVLAGGAGVLWYVAVQIQNSQLRAAREEIARLAVAEERLRFSRDLHDLLGHSLSLIVLKAELAHRMAGHSPERTAREVSDIEKVAREALREVREAVTGYRQPNLSQELESASQTLRSAGAEVLVAGGAGTLSGAMDAALAWTVREATTNVIRHARARRVRIGFTREDHLVRLRMVNDGVPTGGPATSHEGNGLRGLRERLRALGGDLTYGPGRADEFALDASLPLGVEEAPAPAALA